MIIKKLSKTSINRITAGEVVDRPAGALKELVENSLDSGASEINIIIRNGGKNLIRVTDNGYAMSADDLAMSVQSHTTSKLCDGDLSFISTLGFRGEALPSIGSIAKLTITSRQQTMDNAFKITVNGGVVGQVEPCSGAYGTVVEIVDLFYATPARLKFMKTDRAESSNILDCIRHLSIPHENVSFRLVVDGIEKLNLKSNSKRLDRITDILGDEFKQNHLEIENTKENITVSGFVSVGTLHYNSNQKQFLYVNGRWVKDKQILGAIRAAYMDVVPKGRHPYVCLFINTDPYFTDVNVHPTKAEIRFRDSALIRSMIISAIRRQLNTTGLKSATTLQYRAIDKFKAPQFMQTSNPAVSNRIDYSNSTTLNEASSSFENQLRQTSIRNLPPSAKSYSDNFVNPQPSDYLAEKATTQSGDTPYPLGVAKAQIHKNFIISQTDDGIIIVDGHAAHERIVYERIKAKYYHSKLDSQILLLPEVISLPEGHIENLMNIKAELENLGLVFEKISDDEIELTQLPALLKHLDSKTLICDIASELEDLMASTTLKEKIDYVCATIACHSSVRTGRSLNIDEMNSLLRQMEITKNADTCNHGRPTYLSLSLGDIEKLFSR